MTEIPRRRAQINGLYVQFDSRNPHLATIRWHPRFKQRYRTKADALAAKAKGEEDGKILWPNDLRKPKKAAPKPVIRYRATEIQQEMRL